MFHVIQLRRMFAFFAARLRFNLFSTSTPPGPFLQNSFQVVSLQPALMLGVIPLQQQDLALPLVELHEIHLCPILQPIKTPLNGSTPILCINHLASSVNLLRVQPVPSSKSLIKTLNSICPSIHPWDTLVVSGLQLGFVQLIPTFELGSSASFQPISLLIHLTLTSSVCL